MLGQCINAKKTDWVTKLPAIEFAINSAPSRSESTGFAPFFLNSGRMPRSMIWNLAPPIEFPYHSSDPILPIMAKSPFPSFKRYYTHSDSSTPAALRTVPHPYTNCISDTLFIVTDTFAPPTQHYTYSAAAIFACLTHDSAIRDDPVGMKDQPCPIGFDTLARVYNAEARGTQCFAHHAPHPSSNPVITYGDRIQPDDWSITPAQRGIVIENPLFQQLLETPTPTLAPLPILATSRPVISGSDITLESLLSPVVSTSTSDIAMSGPRDAFSLTADEILDFDENTPSSLPNGAIFENDTTFNFDGIPDTTL